MDLETAEVISHAVDPAGRVRKTRIDEDGYVKCPLFRRVSGRVKRSRQLYMSAFVHRLVMAKKLAVAMHGDTWREHVKDLPAGVDVDHEDLDRANNTASNLRLRLQEYNRGRVEETEEEREALVDFLGYDPDEKVPF